MELRQLKYFKEACELQNFSEAARVLHISQSTLSQQIKQLEEELDVLLFDRIGKRVVPTEAGTAFLPYAIRAIQDAEGGKQIIRDLKGIETGTLHIGATYSLSPLLIAALTSFSQAYPKIKVDITFATSEELMEQLDGSLLDFVLSFRTHGMYESFDTVPLFTSRLCFVVHQSHPLAGLSSVSLKRIAQTPLILPDKGFATRKKIEEICQKHALRLNIGVEVNDVHTIVHALRSGLWATILTEAAIRGEVELMQIPILYADRLTSPAFLFWPQGSYRKNAAREFVRHLLSAAGLDESGSEK